MTSATSSATERHGFGATNMSIYCPYLALSPPPYPISILREFQNHILGGPRSTFLRCSLIGSLQQQLLQMWPKPKNAECAHCARSISRTGDSCAMKLNRSTQGYILGAPIEFHRVAIARSRDGARTIMKIRSFLTPSIAPV